MGVAMGHNTVGGKSPMCLWECGLLWLTRHEKRKTPGSQLFWFALGYGNECSLFAEGNSTCLQQLYLRSSRVAIATELSGLNGHSMMILILIFLKALPG
jgi:hypothetical protein